MSNIEYDLKEILTRIKGRFDKLEGKIDNLGADVKDLQREVWVLSTEAEPIIKRIDTKELINRGVIIRVVLWLIAIAFLNRRWNPSAIAHTKRAAN